MLIHCYGFSLERVEVKTKARNKHLDVRQRAAVFNRQSIIVSCSPAPPESGTGSALADSVMQINSKDNTVCSNLFSSARWALRASERVWGLRMYEWRNWTRRMRVKSICWLKYINAFAQHMWIFCNNKQKKKKQAKNRPRTDCLFGYLAMQIDLLPVFIQMVLAWRKRKWGQSPRWTLNTQRRVRSRQMWSRRYSYRLQTYLTRDVDLRTQGGDRINIIRWRGRKYSHRSWFELK